MTTPSLKLRRTLRHALNPAAGVASPGDNHGDLTRHLCRARGRR